MRATPLYHRLELNFHTQYAEAKERARTELELLPGKYTLTGTRDGYRDVRREIAVKPGDGKPVFELHCTDTI